VQLAVHWLVAGRSESPRSSIRSVRLPTVDLSKKKRIHQSNPRVRGKREGDEEEEEE
jgi:hypothetical protein